MLKIYNTLTKTKEEFQPIHPGKVGMYVCGPTVYDHCHLGHARGYVNMDTIRRHLEYSGLEVRYIMNYTDVGHLVHDAEVGEDKIEQIAKAEKINPLDVADRYIQSCEEDFTSLNIKKASFNPRPTQYIAQIIKFVADLIEKDIAYEANGSVYFSVEKFPQYGKLSGRKTDELLEGARVEKNPEKKNPLDFALWIKANSEHILKWPSPWSEGYPGWHIECSVMSSDIFAGETFDIHGGGNENIFPHNENEIAQSEAHLGEKMANFWVLWSMVNIEEAKMSKSLKNQTTIKAVLEKYDPMVVRLWILSSHYHSPISYSENSLAQAESNLKRITDFIINLRLRRWTSKSESGENIIDLEKYKKDFEKAMNDDFNTPVALSVVYDLITETNKLLQNNKLGTAEAKNILVFWEKINKVLGLAIAETTIEIPENITKIAEARKSARQTKDFQKSDDLRKEIEKLGYTIEDLKDNEYQIKKL
ncbi:MAG: cysteine--tRNA ligase [Candidatus Moranbacteria bacterium CG10_big_fil_rev_8_21_14_0_10_35_21]|nr:MAG: cysteine--tRNA ligase [Candidatus Moranbacteria bacterium CG10_big_fil_rev_8_21_14_0_10_35_21]PJA88529.1 MAG: cysteine--tRNA ligase [Candidatus Moranbacteria bacterium CG_4_9_14_3_um_filter_36_9]